MPKVSHIRDLGPPAVIPIVYVAAICLKLELTLAANRTAVLTGGRRSAHQSKERVTQQGQVNIQAGVESQTVTNQTKSMVRSALECFFCSKPVAGAKIWRPRVFSSSSLSDLAPGVFSPYYSEAIQSRQKLTSTIAKVLAASTSTKQIIHTNSDNSSTVIKKSVRSTTWYEGKLWSSMMCGVRMPARSHVLRSAINTSVQRRGSSQLPRQDDASVVIGKSVSPLTFD